MTTKQINDALLDIKKRKQVLIKTIKHFERNSYIFERIYQFQEKYKQNLREEYEMQHYINKLLSSKNISDVERDSRKKIIITFLNILKEETEVEFSKLRTIYKRTYKIKSLPVNDDVESNMAKAILQE